jgi:hypothetical protein
MLNGVQKYGKKLKIKQRRAKFYEFILITPGFMVVSSAIFTGLLLRFPNGPGLYHKDLQIQLCY